MRTILVTLVLAALTTTAAQAQEKASTPVTLESYYRLSWGGYREWLRLYTKNEAPVLAELQRQGLILSYSAERPFTHMAGGARWDFRMRVTYRDPETAVATGGTFDAAWAAAVKKLFPNAAEREAEERQRAAIVEEHWDVIVMPHVP
jgi:hypothetical protein